MGLLAHLPALLPIRYLDVCDTAGSRQDGRVEDSTDPGGPDSIPHGLMAPQVPGAAKSSPIVSHSAAKGGQQGRGSRSQPPSAGPGPGAKGTGGWSVGGSQVENYIHILIRGDCEQQISTQTMWPQLLGGLPGSGSAQGQTAGSGTLCLSRPNCRV